MKKIISLFLIPLFVISSVLCVDLTGFAKTMTAIDELNTIQSPVPGIDNEKALSKYPEFMNYRTSGEFVIPGLEAAVSYKDKQYVLCDTMVPQAMCKVGGRTLITAYDSDGECKSVIYVLNKNDRLVKTLILPDSYHVGGISYDSDNRMIVIAKSGKQCLGCISADDFIAYLSSDKPYVKIKYTISECSLSTKPPTASGVTFHNGKIYISSFNSGYNSCMLCYTPEYDSEFNSYNLRYNYRVSLPNYVQGITLYDCDGASRLLLSVSYGRCESKGVYESYIYTYNFNTETGEKSINNILTCPPMLQQTFCYHNRLYCLFENGAGLYREVNRDPLDIVVPIRVNDLCREKSGTVINIGYKKVNGGKQVNVTSNIDNATIYYSTNGICPYISNKSVYNGMKFEPYLKTLSSPIYAVAVVDGRIVASDYIYIGISRVSPAGKPSKKARTYNSITLKWKKSSNAKGYRIYRSKEENGEYKPVATINGRKSTTYTDNKLKSETTYYYKIISFRRGYSDSDYTGAVAIKTKKKPSKKTKKSKSKSDKSTE